MTDPRPGATGARRSPNGTAAGATSKKKTTAKKAVAKKAVAKKTTAEKPPTRAAATAKAAEAARKRAERERLRAALPPLDPHYRDVWERGTAEAYASRNADPVRVSLRSVHKKRLTAIEKRTGLARQVVLNRAIAAAWEKLGMNGSTLEKEALRLRKQPSAAAGTVSLYPTAGTLRIFRQADHPHAKAVLLQTGLDLWA